MNAPQTLPQPLTASPSITPADPPAKSSGNWKRYMIAALVGAVSLVFLLIAGIVGLLIVSEFAPEDRKKLFSSEFDPEFRDTLRIGSAAGVAQSHWPETIGSLTHRGSGSDATFASTSLGNARYEDADRQWMLDIALVPYAGAEDYALQVNEALINHGDGGDDGHSMTMMSGGSVIFGVNAIPSERLLFQPLQRCFLAISISKTSAGEWDEDGLTEVLKTIVAAIADPAPTAIGFNSYNEEKKGALPYLRGPAAASAEKWPSLNPSDDKFALTRTGLPLPQEFARLKGDGATVSALNLEANARRQVDAYFVARAPGATEEDTFQSVIEALADENDRVPHRGYRYFSLTKNEQKVSWGAVHFIKEKDGICSVTALDNGVLICRTSEPAADEPAGALPKAEDVAYDLVVQLAIKWNDAQG